MTFDIMTFDKIAKIAICTSYRKDIEYYASHTSINKKIYCDLHGYDFIIETKILDNNRLFYWDKLTLIRQNINNYDWLLWIDADAAITNNNISIEQYIDPNYDIIIAKQESVQKDNSDFLNTGVFLIKNSKWSRDFLTRWYSQEQFATIPYHEQSAFIYLYNKEKDVRDHVKIMKQKSFNSFPWIWSEGDFIVHFAGISDRLPLIDISYGNVTWLKTKEYARKAFNIIALLGIGTLGYYLIKDIRIKDIDNPYYNNIQKNNFSIDDAKRIGDQLEIPWNTIPLQEFYMGLNVELEHANVTNRDEIMTGKIALAHLNELPDYYTRLKNMEQ